jgi:hypothetical protein
MISSGKINNKFIKMEEIINGLKQIKTRVDSGTITTVNGTETLLSKQLASMLEKAINYTRCCEEFFCEYEDLEYSSKKCKEQCDGCKWIENL